MGFRNGMRSVILFAVMFVWISPAVCQMNDESKLRSSYASIFENCVKQSESKAKMSRSKSDNIRQAAYISSLKVKFFKKNKDLLIDEMIRSNLPTKSYRVQYFLNDCFFTYLASRPGLEHGLLEANLN